MLSKSIFSNVQKHLITFSLLTNFPFSDKKASGKGDIPANNLLVKVSTRQMGEQNFELFKTKGAISILPGSQQTSKGELYAIPLICKKCKKKDMRSFTKQAYEKGLVLSKCQCGNVQLVADHLHWFEEGDGMLKDPIEVVKFVRKAFEEVEAEDQERNHQQTSSDSTSPISAQTTHKP